MTRKTKTLFLLSWFLGGPCFSWALQATIPTIYHEGKNQYVYCRTVFTLGRCQSVCLIEHSIVLDLSWPPILITFRCWWLIDRQAAPSLRDGLWQTKIEGQTTMKAKFLTNDGLTLTAVDDGQTDFIWRRKFHGIRNQCFIRIKHDFRFLFLTRV